MNKSITDLTVTHPTQSIHSQFWKVWLSHFLHALIVSSFLTGFIGCVGHFWSVPTSLLFGGVMNWAIWSAVVVTVCVVVALLLPRFEQQPFSALMVGFVASLVASGLVFVVSALPLWLIPKITSYAPFYLKIFLLTFFICVGATWLWSRFSAWIARLIDEKETASYREHRVRGITNDVD